VILVDTSVWVDHFRGREKNLTALLLEGSVLTHSLVIEELACGNLQHRDEILELLESLPQAPRAGHSELLDFIDGNKLHGAGIGAVDIHLLASARLGHARLWSKDKALCRAARRLDILAPQGGTTAHD